MAGLGASGKGKELGGQVLAEFHQSVTTVPAQSHQWPARGDSTAAGEVPGGICTWGHLRLMPQAWNPPRMRKNLGAAVGLCSI